jgi:hypothetical protein
VVELLGYDARKLEEDRVDLRLADFLGVVGTAGAFFFAMWTV